MTRVIIEGLRGRACLINAISVVLETLNQDDAYTYEEHVFVPHSAEPMGGADRTGEAEAPDGDVPLDPDPAAGMRRVAGPTPFVPCPRRGTHGLLTECWMCWSDVMRGAALEPEVLSPAAWRVAGSR